MEKGGVLSLRRGDDTLALSTLYIRTGALANP